MGARQALSLPTAGRHRFVTSERGRRVDGDSSPREREAINLARLHIEIWIEDDDLRRPLLWVEEAATTTSPAREPYGALAELDALLSHAKTALGGQAHELAVQLQPIEEVRT